ncbi:MAG: hypothetical protein NTW09_00285 [Candidatus Omnitrophica bacterium]|nr:hypothetical protein [Candidatus Omnitrophota bacterium]
MIIVNGEMVKMDEASMHTVAITSTRAWGNTNLTSLLYWFII